MSFTTLENQRIQEYLPEVMSWCAKAINEREEAINWAWDERSETGKLDVPAPWLMIDGETYKTYPEPDDFAPSADLWQHITYGGYFLQQARKRIGHMIGASSHGTEFDSYHPKQAGGPAGTIQAEFDPEQNAYYMAGDWRPWSSMEYPGGPAIGIANPWGTNIRAFLQAIGYEDGRWISEAFPVAGGTWYVDTPIHDPRKWYQLREAIRALKWFRVLHCNFIDKTRMEIQITQNEDEDFSLHDIRGDYNMTTPVNTFPLMKISPNELYTKWEEAWNAKSTDTVFEFAPLAGTTFKARGADNLDTALWYDWKGYFRVEAVGKYRMKLGYLENFHGLVANEWMFSWRIVDLGYPSLSDNYGNVYEGENDPGSPYRLVTHMNAGSSLTLGEENFAELLAEIPESYPLTIPEETDPTIGDSTILSEAETSGFISEGQSEVPVWVGATDLTLKCEGSFTYT